MSAADFDRWAAEHDVQPEDWPTAFAEWLAEQTGEPVIGERGGADGDAFLAAPNDPDV